MCFHELLQKKSFLWMTFLHIKEMNGKEESFLTNTDETASIDSVDITSEDEAAHSGMTDLEIMDTQTYTLDNDIPVLLFLVLLLLLLRRT